MYFIRKGNCRGWNRCSLFEIGKEKSMIKTFSFHSPLSATQLTKVWPLSFIFFFSRVVCPLSAILSQGIIWSEVLVLTRWIKLKMITSIKEQDWSLCLATLMCFYYPAEVFHHVNNLESRTVRLCAGPFRHQGRSYQSMFKGGCKIGIQMWKLKYQIKFNFLSTIWWSSSLKRIKKIKEETCPW